MASSDGADRPVRLDRLERLPKVEQARDEALATGLRCCATGLRCCATGLRCCATGLRCCATGLRCCATGRSGRPWASLLRLARRPQVIDG
jgi:hypothetical protein